MSNKAPLLVLVALVALILSAFGPITRGNGENTTPEHTGLAFSEDAIDSIYMVLTSEASEMPKKEVFASAFRGYLKVRGTGRIETETITIIDFTLPSTEKRMWVIDLRKGEILHHSLVAHGKNSGELYAKNFSNKHNSYQSSLGFFRTGEIYTGKHGMSLKLHGLEPGINDQAEARAIVIHSAEYVDEKYARKLGRLGRSWGCPAIPVENHEEVIRELAGGSCLFIYYPDESYLSSSRLAGA